MAIESTKIPIDTENKQPEAAGEKPNETLQQLKVREFSGLNLEEKVQRVTDVLHDSTGLESAYQDIELEVGGGESNLRKQVKLGWSDRFKIWRAGGEGSKEGKEIEFRKIAEIAHQEMDKKLGLIEQTDGQSLREKKQALIIHEKNAEADLKNLKDMNMPGMPAEDLENFRAGLSTERAVLNQEVEASKTELVDKLAEYREPAQEKQQQLSECLEEYQGYRDSVNKEITTIRANLARYERGLTSLKSTGPTAEEYKGRIRQEIIKQQGDLTALEVSKQALEQRLEAVKENKKQVDEYVERIKKIGETPEETRARKEKERGARERKAGQTAGIATGGEATAEPPPVTPEATSQEVVEEDEDELAGPPNQYDRLEQWSEGDNEQEPASENRGAEARVESPVSTPSDTGAGLENPTETKAEEEKQIDVSTLVEKLFDNFTEEQLVEVQRCFGKESPTGQLLQYAPTAKMTEDEARKAYKRYNITVNGLPESNDLNELVNSDVGKIYHPK